MKKIKRLKEISSREKSARKIILVSADLIRCRYWPVIMKTIKNNSPVWVAFPINQLRKGSAGWAKSQIFASMEGVKGIVGYNQKEKEEILKDKSLKIIRIEELIKTVERARVSRKVKENDRRLMKEAFKLVSQSNCWWRPTACLFARRGEILIRGYSVNSFGSECQKIKLSPSRIMAELEEQIHFCNAVHAEAMAVARAAKKGISLQGATLYITVCPCEECAKILLETGIKRVVFAGEYYQRTGLALLKQAGIQLAKVL